MIQNYFSSARGKPALRSSIIISSFQVHYLKLIVQIISYYPYNMLYNIWFISYIYTIHISYMVYMIIITCIIYMSIYSMLHIIWRLCRNEQSWKWIARHCCSSLIGRIWIQIVHITNQEFHLKYFLNSFNLNILTDKYHQVIVYSVYLFKLSNWSSWYKSQNIWDFHSSFYQFHQLYFDGRSALDFLLY